MQVSIINTAREQFLTNAREHVESTSHNASKIAMDYLIACVEGISEGDDWDVCKARVCGESTKDNKLIEELVSMGFITNASKYEYFSRLWKGLYMVAFHEEGTEADTLTKAKQEYDALFPTEESKSKKSGKSTKAPKWLKAYRAKTSKWTKAQWEAALKAAEEVAKAS